MERHILETFSSCALLNKNFLCWSFVHIVTIDWQYYEYGMQKLYVYKNCFKNCDTNYGFRHSAWKFRVINVTNAWESSSSFQFWLLKKNLKGWGDFPGLPTPCRCPWSSLHSEETNNLSHYIYTIQNASNQSYKSEWDIYILRNVPIFCIIKCFWEIRSISVSYKAKLCFIGKLSLCLVKHHTMKKFGGCRALPFLTRWGSEW
jgi:hypothetical protein